MGCLATTKLSSGGLIIVLVSLLATQSKLTTAFMPRPYNLLGSTRSLRTRGRMDASQPNAHGKPTTRQGVFQKVSTIAGVIAASGAVIKGDPAEVAADGLPVPSTSAGVVTETDRRGVEKTTVRWKDTVTLGTADAPKQTAALYAPDAVLWGTVSEEVRDTPAEIYDYFDYFARLPKLRLSEYTPVSVRVYGDFATQAGTYTFAWQGADGETKEKRARFSFTFRRDSSSPTDWTIVEHHSSAMPTSPAQLKRARNDVF